MKIQYNLFLNDYFVFSCGKGINLRTLGGNIWGYYLFLPVELVWEGIENAWFKF